MVSLVVRTGRFRSSRSVTSVMTTAPGLTVWKTLSQLVPVEETTIRTTKRTPTETKRTFFQSAVPGSWAGFGGFFRLMDWFRPAFGLG